MSDELGDRLMFTWLKELDMAGDWPCILALEREALALARERQDSQQRPSSKVREDRLYLFGDLSKGGE